MDRASPDPERLGHPQDTNTLRKVLSHLAFGRAVYLRTAALYRPSYPDRPAARPPDHCRERLYRPLRGFEAGRGPTGSGVRFPGSAAGAAGGGEPGRVKLTGPPAICR